jgi:ribosomal protein S24E
MNIKIREQRDNMLYRRKELKIDVETDTTPGRESAKNLVCDAVGCKDAHLVRIIKIDSKFGENVFTIVAEVYDSLDDLKEYSPTLKKKDFEAEKKEAEEIEAAKVKAEEPQVPEISDETPTEGAPTEEKNEEPKEENKAPEGIPSNEGKDKKE